MSIKSVSDFVLKLVYLARFSEFCNKHPCKRFEAGWKARFEFYDFLVESEKLEKPISYLEFGVYKGKSIRWWVQKNKHPESEFVGFDSFLGLPENWTSSMPRGTFTTDGKIPQIEDQRCSFEVGWFQNTLPKFIEKFSFYNKQTVLNLDADLYNSTLFVLLTMAPKLKKGDILIFDEFSDYLNEFRAFFDFTSIYQIDYGMIARIGNFDKVAMGIGSTRFEIATGSSRNEG